MLTVGGLQRVHQKKLQRHAGKQILKFLDLNPLVRVGFGLMFSDAILANKLRPSSHQSYPDDQLDDPDVNVFDGDTGEVR